MSLNLDDKKAVVAEVSAQVANAQTIVVAEYRGMEVGHLTVLRSKAREQGVYLRVLKNTLAKRAVADTAFAGLAEHMTGPLIYSISSDAVAPARVLNDFAKPMTSWFCVPVLMAAKCWTRQACKRSLRSRAAKYCWHSCWVLCSPRFLASRASLPPWPRKRAKLLLPDLLLAAS